MIKTNVQGQAYLNRNQSGPNCETKQRYAIRLREAAR